MKKIETISKLKEICNQLKKRKKTVGLITGVFDILHYQHVEFLSFAKKKVDMLIVGIECDENVKLFKGNNRPIFNFNQRFLVLSSLESIDYVFKIPAIKKEQSDYSDFYKNIIKKIDIDVLIASRAKDGSWVEKKKSAKELNIKFITYNEKFNVSSSEIISRVMFIK
ncbi:MAG: adenylyltransferase/cytidyltransferase family protein [Minisyncoccales bacterium]